jgi:hypothetical protein
MPAIVANPGGAMTRLPRLTFALLLALAGACSDDETGPTDAGQDARRDGSSGCTMADCQAIPKPRLSCTPPTFPEFTCVRTNDLRCAWGQERCAPGADGGSPTDATGGTTDVADGSSDAAGDAPADL